MPYFDKELTEREVWRREKSNRHFYSDTRPTAAHRKTFAKRREATGEAAYTEAFLRLYAPDGGIDDRRYRGAVELARLGICHTPVVIVAT